MNRYLAAAAFLSVPFIALAGPAEQIKANYALVDKCIMKMDMPGLNKAFDSFCTKNFIYQNPMMKGTLAQMKSGFASEFKSIKKITSCKSTTSNLVFKGNEATLMSVHKLAYVGKDGHKYSASIHAEDTWIKLGSTWKMTREIDNALSMTKDGKPINMTAVPKASRVSQ